MISLIQEIGWHLRDVGLQCETDQISCFDFYDEIKKPIISILFFFIIYELTLSSSLSSLLIGFVSLQGTGL